MFCGGRWCRGTRRSPASTGTTTRTAAARVPARRQIPSSTTTSTGDFVRRRPPGSATSARTSCTPAAVVGRPRRSSPRRTASVQRQPGAWSPAGGRERAIEVDVGESRLANAVSSRRTRRTVMPQCCQQRRTDITCKLSQMVWGSAVAKCF